VNQNNIALLGKEENNMLWIIGGVSAILAIIFFVLMLADIFGDQDWTGALRKFITTVIAVIVVVGCCHSLEAIYNLRYEEITKSGDWPLVSLQESSQIKGQGNGGLLYVRVSIENTEVYKFYYQLGDGYKFYKIPAESAIIFEQEKCTPHFVQNTVYVKNKMASWLQNTLTFGFPNTQYNTFDLFVPKGSVVQDFNLDLK
jgi:hypothetical protein